VWGWVVLGFTYSLIVFHVFFPWTCEGAAHQLPSIHPEWVKNGRELKNNIFPPLLRQVHQVPVLGILKDRVSKKPVKSRSKKWAKGMCEAKGGPISFALILLKSKLFCFVRLQAFRIILCKDWQVPLEGKHNKEDIGLCYFTEILCRLSDKKEIGWCKFLYTM
jgi:hypothetical protein